MQYGLTVPIVNNSCDFFARTSLLQSPFTISTFVMKVYLLCFDFFANSDEVRADIFSSGYAKNTVFHYRYKIQNKDVGYFFNEQNIANRIMADLIQKFEQKHHQIDTLIYQHLPSNDRLKRAFWAIAPFTSNGVLHPLYRAKPRALKTGNMYERMGRKA